MLSVSRARATRPRAPGSNDNLGTVTVPGPLPNLGKIPLWELKSVFVFCARRRGILGEQAEEMIPLEEMDTLIGGSCHHNDTSNLPA